LFLNNVSSKIYVATKAQQHDGYMSDRMRATPNVERLVGCDPGEVG